MKDDGFNHVSDFVRVGVKSGGCSGLSYELKFDNKLLENDKIFEHNNLIFLKIRNPQYQLSIEFNKNPVSIIGWEFTNQMGEMIKIRIKDIRKNNYISDEIFKTEKDYKLFKK